MKILTTLILSLFLVAGTAQASEAAKAPAKAASAPKAPAKAPTKPASAPTKDAKK